MLGKMSISNANVLKHGIAILPISIDIFYDEKVEKERMQEGAHFAATIHALNELEPKLVIVVLTGYLQRHNAKIENEDLDDKAAEAETLKAEENWRARNGHLISRLTTPHIVTHWKEWMGADFEARNEEINEEYRSKKTKSGLPSLLKSNISDVNLHFVNGFKKGHNRGNSQKDREFDLDRAVLLSKEYLLEEISVTTLWRDRLFPETLRNNPEWIKYSEAENNQQSISYMIYPFGNSTVSSSVYKCMSDACASDHFHIEKIGYEAAPSVTIEKTKKENAGNKKSKQVPTPTHARNKSPQEKQRSGSDLGVERQSEVEQVMQVVKGTFKVSKLDIECQIAALQGLLNEIEIEAMHESKQEQAVTPIDTPPSESNITSRGMWPKPPTSPSTAPEIPQQEENQHAPKQTTLSG